MHPDATKRPSAVDILKISSVQTDNEPATLILEVSVSPQFTLHTVLSQ